MGPQEQKADRPPLCPQGLCHSLLSAPVRPLRSQNSGQHQPLHTPGLIHATADRGAELGLPLGLLFGTRAWPEPGGAPRTACSTGWELRPKG